MITTKGTLFMEKAEMVFLNQDVAKLKNDPSPDSRH